MVSLERVQNCSEIFSENENVLSREIEQMPARRGSLFSLENNNLNIFNLSLILCNMYRY